MEPGVKKVVLNVGCGLDKRPEAVNIDLYGEPDIRWDLNKTPWPFPDNSFVHVRAHHVFEHLDNWWGAFCECARVLAPNGTMEARMPHASSTTALSYRDHKRAFSVVSFHGITGTDCGTNAWAQERESSVSLKLVGTILVPFKPYEWMSRWCPWLLMFCANHMRNFIWEQRYYFQSTKPIGG